MTDAHYEAVRFASMRAQTAGSTRKCLLPFRLWPKPAPPPTKVSHQFIQFDEPSVQRVTHQHILSK
jgi:hypothetical protein